MRLRRSGASLARDLLAVLGHQPLLDVVEPVAQLLDQRLQPVGGTQAQAGHEIGGRHRRMVALLPLRDAEELGDVELATR